MRRVAALTAAILLLGSACAVAGEPAGGGETAAAPWDMAYWLLVWVVKAVIFLIFVVPVVALIVWRVRGRRVRERLQDIKHDLVRLAGVYDDGEVGVGGEGQVLMEDLFSRRAGSQVAVEVEAGLSHGHHLGLAEQLSQPVEVTGRDRGRLMRTDAHGRVDVREPGRERDSPLA